MTQTLGQKTAIAIHIHNNRVLTTYSFACWSAEVDMGDFAQNLHDACPLPAGDVLSMHALLDGHNEGHQMVYVSNGDHLVRDESLAWAPARECADPLQRRPVGCPDW